MKKYSEKDIIETDLNSWSIPDIEGIQIDKWGKKYNIHRTHEQTFSFVCKFKSLKKAKKALIQIILFAKN